MKIETKRLIIRPFKKSDYKQVTACCNDYDVAKSTMSIPIPFTDNDAKVFIESTLNTSKSDGTMELAVELKETKTVVGYIGLVGIYSQSKHAEIGYWVGKNYWNKGIATEAVKAMINYAFTELKLHSILAKHFENNLASGAVMKKCGMRYVGKIHEHEFRMGQYYTVMLYELLEKDFKKVK